MWEPTVSPHKLDLYRALRRHAAVGEVIYVAQEGLFEERVQQGWQLGGLDDVTCVTAPTAEDVRRMVRESPPDAIHLFSGIHWVPCIVEGLRAVISAGRRFGLMSEPRVLEGPKGLARLAHSWVSEGAVRRQAGFVLAIGRHGPSWFRLAGYRRIFPFAYFLPDQSTGRRVEERPADAPVRLTYLGRLARPKGVHLFLEALSHIRVPVAVTVAGGGDDAGLVEAFCRAQPGRIDYCGVIPMTEVPDLLARTDILMQPSITRDDGWAAVVSEALMAGAAVIATEQVGASICLDDRRRGVVVRRADAAHLARAVDDFVAGGGLEPAHRSYRAAWAVAHLTGAMGARTLVAILEHIYSGGPPPPSYLDGPPV